MKIRDALRVIKPLEARILLSYISGFSVEYLMGHADDELADEVYEQFLFLVERRKADEPIAYIVGKKEFYGRDFKVTKDVLIPRADSEVIIDAVLAEVRYDNSINILELGIGSGCLLLTLLAELTNASGTGVDISREALEVAKENAVSLSLGKKCDLKISDWFHDISGKYDIIISNPPYIYDKEKDLMAAETLKYEPHLALFGGLAAYKIIASRAHEFLAKNGRVYLEIGYRQSAEVIEIFQKRGYEVAGKHQDIEKRDRVLVFVLARD